MIIVEERENRCVGILASLLNTRLCIMIGLPVPHLFLTSSYVKLEMLRCAVAVTVMILRDHLKHKGNRREGGEHSRRVALLYTVSNTDSSESVKEVIEVIDCQISVNDGQTFE